MHFVMKRKVFPLVVCLLKYLGTASSHKVHNNFSPSSGNYCLVFLKHDCSLCTWSCFIAIWCKISSFGQSITVFQLRHNYFSTVPKRPQRTCGRSLGLSVVENIHLLLLPSQLMLNYYLSIYHYCINSFFLSNVARNKKPAKNSLNNECQLLYSH